MASASADADIDETASRGTLGEWSEKVRRSISLWCADAHGKVEHHLSRRRSRRHLQAVFAALKRKGDAWKWLFDDDPEREGFWRWWRHARL